MIDLPPSSCSKEEYLEHRENRLRLDDLTEQTIFTTMIAFRGPGPEALRYPAQTETIDRNIGSRSLWLSLLDENFNSIVKVKGNITDCGLWLPAELVNRTSRGTATAYEGYLLEYDDGIDMGPLEELSIDGLKKIRELQPA